MSFEAILQEIHDECGGCLGVALMGSDGIPVVQIESPAAPGGDPVDVATAGVEFGRILGEIRKASDALTGGAMTETVISLSRFTLLFRCVDEDLVLVMALDPDGNMGKARYLMRRHLLALREEI